jgi:hypothetical protein
MKQTTLLLVLITVCVILSLVYTLAVNDNLWSASRLMGDAWSASESVPIESRSIILGKKDDAPVDKILVVYSGPTDLLDPNIRPEQMKRTHKKMELYRLNFELFLRHGIHCQTQDTLLVVTDVVKARYQTQIDELHNQCHHNYGNYVRLLVRNNTCLDLDSVRVAIEYTTQGNRPAVVSHRSTTNNDTMPLAYYDYFVYMNCGVSGPSLQWSSRPWTSIFLQGLRDGVKMTGLSMNCKFHMPHIQSMMYAMDREGLQIVIDGGAIFDCTKQRGYSTWDRNRLHATIVSGYEVKMSRLLLKAGYGISSVVRPTTIFQTNSTQCLNEYRNDTLNDIWISKRLIEYYGKIPSLDDVVFFKTSRILTPETANLINYTLRVDWNWR